MSSPHIKVKNSSINDLQDNPFYKKSSPRIIKFIEQQVELEKNRLVEQGARILPVKIRNTALILERRGKGTTPSKVNQIEFTTTYDFDNVVQILISNSIPVPHGEESNLRYVNLILLVGGPIAMLVPYIYKQEDDNNLNEWMLVNANGKCSRLRVENFKTIDEDGDQ